MSDDDTIRANEPDAPASAETHISWVLLTGDRALKIYKPVRTDVLDHRDVAERRRACEREVELNRRLAPDVYEGVGEIALADGSIEPVIVMRRMPALRRLARLLDEPEALDLVRAVARRIATFHETATVLDPDAATTAASRASLRERWTADVSALRQLADPCHSNQIDAIGALAQTYLAGREQLFRDRIAQGLIRDGHGDLLADDIFCLDDGPRVLDCLAFSDQLRCGDVLADLAFLVMDLQRLGHPALARHLLSSYCEFSGEHHPGSLAHFYVAQRAAVRAKVSALRASQAPDSSSDVGALLDLALDHLQRAAVRVVLIGGLPGSGKSTMASRLSDELGWAVLSSDDIRRDLGLRYQDLHDNSAYDEETVARVYDEMGRRTDQMIARGISVILDATWTSEHHRQQARAIASGGDARIVELRCRAPLATCRARVRTRSGESTSEATPAVVDVLNSRADPWPEAIVLDTVEVPDPIGGHHLDQALALWWSTSALAPIRRAPKAHRA